MDNVQHLLRLNVEIEGALRVLETGTNEIASKILYEKAQELFKIVHNIVHPKEEKSASIDTQTSSSDNSLFCDNLPPDNLGQEDFQLAKQELHDTRFSESAPKPRPFGNDDENNENVSFEDTLTESVVQTRIMATENDKELETAPIMNKDIVESIEKEGITEYNIIGEESKHMVSIDSPADSQETIQNKSLRHLTTQESLKEKFRIDEMFSRREARDLSKAFTINDRFRFQLHIFDGNKDAFNTSIEVISKLRDYESALEYLAGLIDIDSDDNDLADFLTIVQNHFEVN